MDVSQSALDLGERLFQENPVIGGCISEPQFIRFDGYTIDLPNDAVDRIVCFDALHHIPNPDQILKEMARVLKPGGIAGFSEPGRFHSRSPQSQSEMANCDVLENDINLEDIISSAMKGGFTGFYCKMLTDLGFDMDLATHRQILSSRNAPARQLARSLWPRICDPMTSGNIFFLKKGEATPDSRSHVGLAHNLKVESAELNVSVGATLSIPVEVINTGSAKWLIRNIKDIGVVKLGAHLYDEQNRLLDLGFARSVFDADVYPDEKRTNTIEVRFDKIGTYLLGLDLVSEQVAWFENLGSRMMRVKVNVI
jgi:SAM-dependent methyltransferase